jgi:hypothetical protein
MRWAMHRGADHSMNLAADDPEGRVRVGRKANMMKWKEQLNGDCPKRDAH